MDIIKALEQEEIKRLGKTIPEFSPGDTVVVNVNVVEGDRKRVPFVPAGNGKHLATDFPHMGPTPLNHICRMGQRSAKGIIGLKLHAPLVA